MDTGRSAGDVHLLYAYAHVPQGYSGRATTVIIDQIERFAPLSTTRTLSAGTSRAAQ